LVFPGFLQKRVILRDLLPRCLIPDGLINKETQVLRLATFTQDDNKNSKKGPRYGGPFGISLYSYFTKLREFICIFGSIV
jgi:hypothetical protein